MRVTIYYNGLYEDELSFTCEDIEEAREIAFREIERRWREQEHCSSSVER